MRKKTAKTTTNQSVLKRIEALEKRPDILALDPDQDYIILVPRTTTDDDWKALDKALARSPNVVAIEGDSVKIISVG